MSVLLSCQKDQPVDNDYSKYVTIKQGVWGSVVFREGNWQPVIDWTQAKEYPVRRTICIYRLTPNSSAVPASGEGPSFFDQINTTRVAQTKSNKNGFYEIELPPGQYSVFVKENGCYYCNRFDGSGNLCPVTMSTNTATEINLLIDYKAVY